MLNALRIQSFAVIDELEVQFGLGLNVLTGETGAGKSILVDALQLALGGRAQAELVRSGAEEAAVEALFEAPGLGARLEALGLPADGDEMLVRRTVSRSGRGRAYVNGALSTVALLTQATRGLVDISGQHEHVSLLDSAGHLALLDGFARLEPELAAYREAYEALACARKELESLSGDDAERARKADYLSFQLEEIERIAPRPGEELELAEERRRLVSAAKLRAASEEGERALYSGDGAAVEVVGAVLSRLEEAVAIDPALASVRDTLKSALVELEDAARALGHYGKELESDPGRLEEIDERLEGLKRLCRKHGADLAAVLLRKEAMRAELDGLSRHGERLGELGSLVEERERAALALAQSLSEKRKKACKEFARAARVELADLAMDKTVFEVAFEGGLSLGPSGTDRAELLLGPNPGEQPKPLARIASGGELSRVMLALKRVLAQSDPVHTYAFDEVDTGIGGAVAEVVGRMLKEVSRERQVLCVTHLPQVAAFADRHFVVEKSVKEGRTRSEISALSKQADRQREIARMLAGVEVTRAALTHAGEMIRCAAEPGRGAHP